MSLKSIRLSETKKQGKLVARMASVINSPREEGEGGVRMDLATFNKLLSQNAGIKAHIQSYKDKYEKTQSEKQSTLSSHPT